MQKLAFLIVLILASYVVVFLVCLIVGLVIVDTAPVWGIVLLSIAGLQVLFPLVFMLVYAIQDVIEARRKKKEKEKKAAETTGAFSSRSGSLFRFSDRRKHLRLVPQPSDFIWLGILIILVFLAYATLAVLGIVFGISLIVMGTYFWGILLLTLGSFLILFPIIVLTVTNYQDKKEDEQKKAAGATGAFGPTAQFVHRFHKKKRSLSNRPEMPWLGVLIILLALLYLALVVICVVFGASLIAMGSYFWGILLLALGAFIVIRPIVRKITRYFRKKKVEKRKAAQTKASFERVSRSIAEDELPAEESRYSPKEVLLGTLVALAALVGMGLLTLGGVALLAAFPFWGIFLIAIAGMGFAALIQWLLMLTGERMEDALFGAYLLTVFIMICAVGVFAVGFCIALLAAGTIGWGIALGIGGALLLTAVIALLIGLSHLG
jgi:MFS family permease